MLKIMRRVVAGIGKCESNDAVGEGDAFIQASIDEADAYKPSVATVIEGNVSHHLSTLQVPDDSDDDGAINAACKTATSTHSPDSLDRSDDKAETLFCQPLRFAATASACDDDIDATEFTVSIPIENSCEASIIRAMLSVTRRFARVSYISSGCAHIKLHAWPSIRFEGWDTIVRFLGRNCGMYSLHASSAIFIDDTLRALRDVIASENWTEAHTDTLQRFLNRSKNQNRMWLMDMDRASVADVCWFAAAEYFCDTRQGRLFLKGYSECLYIARWWDAVSFGLYGQVTRPALTNACV